MLRGAPRPASPPSIPRSRLSLRRFSLPRRPASSVAARVPETEGEGDDSLSDPYGNDYGAGPSRLPYSPPTRSDAPTTKLTPSSTASISWSVSPDGPSTRIRRRKGRENYDRDGFMVHLSTLTAPQRRELLRAAVANLPPSALGSIGNVSRELKWDVRDMSRSEAHVVLHHLIRSRRGDTATALLSEVIETGAVFRPEGAIERAAEPGAEGSELAAVPLRLCRKRYFAGRTLSALFQTDVLPARNARAVPYSLVRSSMFNSNPAPRLRCNPLRSRSSPIQDPAESTHRPSSRLSAITEQCPEPLHRRTLAVLAAIDALRRIRHPRVDSVYAHAIALCIGDNRPDEAAKVYVGLVEEWILEGRVAEGADPDDFYPGGGPPRLPAEIEARVAPPEPVAGQREIVVTSPVGIVDRRKRSLLSMWFSGVRTWKFPGEVMSPHDRLDLWHPRHLALGEKMRGFPFPVPTSPPTLVPMPAVSLLLPILDALHLDPSQSSSTDFAASMRALAILANPILSRTLPIPAIPALLKAFSLSPLVPAVYPESFTDVPDRHGWAYTANTQVHVALLSLLWAPPNFAHAAQLEQRFAPTDHVRRPRGAAQYRLQPLAWNACKVLLYYGLEQIKRPELLPRLFNYMRGTWHTWSSNVANSMFKGTTALAKSHGNTATAQFDDKLFARAALGRGGPELVPEATLPSSGDSSSLHAQTDTIPPTRPDRLAEPNEESLITLIHHLGATSQSPRLVQVVHSIIPFLSFNRVMPDEDVASLLSSHGVDPGVISQRPAAQPLSPRMYVAILTSLSKHGHTGLAQRVFKLALDAETRWNETSRRSARGQGHKYLPIQVFTAMLNVFEKEATAGRGKPESEIVGWRLPPRTFGVSREQGAEAMIAHLYGLARTRWEEAAASERASVPSESVEEPLHISRRSLRLGFPYRPDRSNRLDRSTLTSPRTVKPRSPAMPDAAFFNAFIRARSIRWGLRSSSPLTDSARAELSAVVDDMTSTGVAVPPGLREKLGPGIVKGKVFVTEGPVDGVGASAGKDWTKRNWTKNEVYEPMVVAMQDWAGEGSVVSK